MITFSYYCTFRPRITLNEYEDFFFNGELNEETYMEQPVSFVVKEQKKKIC